MSDLEIRFVPIKIGPRTQKDLQKLHSSKLTGVNWEFHGRSYPLFFRSFLQKSPIPLGAGGSHLLILATWEAEIGRIIVQDQPRQIVWEIPSLEQPEQRQTGGVAQEIECLLCKHRALSSNPTLIKKKNKSFQPHYDFVVKFIVGF
jgi:hypothetical protein